MPLISDISNRTITNDDPAPPVPTPPINDVHIAEGNSGTLSSPSTSRCHQRAKQSLRVDYVTVGGTAEAGSDYQSASGTLTFAIGETSESR